MTDKKLRGSLSREATARQLDVLAAFVECGGSISRAAASLGIRPSTVKRHLADLRARLGLTTEQPIYASGCWMAPCPESRAHVKRIPVAHRPVDVCGNRGAA